MSPQVSVNAYSIFRHLTSVPTAPFYEDAVAAKALGWIKDTLGKKVRVNRYKGGIVIRYQGVPGASLVLAAHLDHPAFHIDRVTKKGARAKVQGGLKIPILRGAAIAAFPARPKDNTPLARGVLGEGKGGIFPVTWTTPLKGTPRFATLDLVPCARKGPWLLSRSIDDLVGCAISLEVLRRIVKSKAKTNLTVILSFAEEVGFVGVLSLIKESRISLDDSILSIETSKWNKDARQGRGPVIRVGDKTSLFDANLLALLDDSATALKGRRLKTQRTRLIGGSCEATAFVAFGYESAGLSIALENYHNTGPTGPAPEMVHYKDIDPAVSLLVEAAKRFPAAKLRGRLRKALSKRLRVASKSL